MIIDYKEFMRRYSNKIIGSLNEYEYEVLLGHVSDIVNESINYNEFYEIDSNKCIEGAMLYLLKISSFDQLLYSNYDDIIENYVIKYNENYYDKKVNKIEGKFKSISKTKKQESIDHIKGLIDEVKSIFDKNTDLSMLGTDIYESLIHDGASEEDILAGKYDFKVLDCIRSASKYNNLRFSNEFNMLYNKITEYTVNTFNKKKDMIEPTNQEYMNEKYNLYSNNNVMNEVAFKAAVTFHLMNYSYNNIDYAKLDNFISRDTNRIMIENSSIISTNRKSKVIRANYKDSYDKEVKDEIENKKKKKRIIIGIIVAIFILENLGYKLVQSFSDGEPKKSSSSQYEYSIDEYEQNRHKTQGEVMVEHYTRLHK